LNKEVFLADIYQDFPIQASPGQVFQAVTTPQGLDAWWTKRSAGKPVEGAGYNLWFGPEYDWQARVTRLVTGSEFELQMTRADADWMGTRVGFRLQAKDEATWVSFRHTCWPSVNDHYRISCHCWALYLRILRRYIEHGEFVPYEDRLNV
jgi:uncharacterized protein YndB with AHSA1/START domain